MQINYCGISGGKDSTATALWLIHESGLPLNSLRFAFCNTHNEHELTYKYINDLSERFIAWSAPAITWLEPELGFYDLAKKKQRFPAPMSRFCTQHLKVIPTRNDIAKLHADGHDVTLYSGVRAAESAERAKIGPKGFDDGFGCYVIRPLYNIQSVDDVFAILEKYKVPRNPLYDMGAIRVGCWPCINSRKSEIRLIAEKFPERIDEIRRWEKDLNPKRFSSFYENGKTPVRFRSMRHYSKRQDKWFAIPTIDDVVTWSKSPDRKRKKDVDPDRGLVCESGKGLCE